MLEGTRHCLRCSWQFRVAAPCPLCLPHRDHCVVCLSSHLRAWLLNEYQRENQTFFSFPCSFLMREHKYRIL